MSNQARRILHLIDPEADNVGPAVCRLLAGAIETASTDGWMTSHHVLLVGTTKADGIAVRGGLHTPDRIHCVGGKAWMNITAFRRYLRGLGPFDLIQAWSPTTFALAAIAAPAVRRSVYLACNPPSKRAARWMRMLSDDRSDRREHGENHRHPPLLLSISNSVKRQWVQDGGIEPDRVHVVRPGLDFSLVRHANRETFRRRWRIRSDRTCVVGVCGHPTSRVDARRAARLLVLAALDGADVAMIVPSGAQHLHTARRLLDSVDAPLQLVVDESLHTPWEAFSACDAALVIGDDTQEVADTKHRFRNVDHAVSGPLPMIWAAASGATIVGEASYAVSEIFEHGHSGLLIRPGNENGLLRRLVQAATDRQSTWSIRDAARSEAFSFFSRSRFASDLATVLRQFATNDDIRVPELPTTGGLRFAGRA